MPAYIEVRALKPREKPSCGDRDCDQLEHQNRVYIGPAILDPVRKSIGAMNTALCEIEAEIEMDSEGPKAPTLLIEAARELRAAIKGAERMLKGVEGKSL